MGLIFTVPNVQAQTNTALVCNTGENTSFGNSQNVGNGTPGGNKRIVAQQFTTGSHANGYTLKKLKAEGGCAGQCRPRIQIYSDSSGSPGSHIGTNSRSFGSRAINTALAGYYTLNPNTNYWAVFEDVRSAAGITQAGIYNLIVTNASSENCSSSSEDWGWSIANNLRWRVNSSASWQTKSKTLKIEAVGYANNITAVGQPSISGTARTGETLTADEANITDANGVPLNLNYQWIRVDGSNEISISGAQARTYIPVRADVGKKVKVKISFTDKSGWEEFTTSNAYPNNGNIRQSPPTASDATISLDEDVVYIFSVADFNYMDADEDTLKNIQITQLPTLGSLTLRGQTVNVNDDISKSNIDAGSLKYTPPDDAYGNNYTTLAFKVRDENGNEYSSATYVLTFDITEVNDPATGIVGFNAGDSYIGTTFHVQFQYMEDPDGLTKVSYNYQWVWVIVNTKGIVISEEDIPHANKASYTLTKKDIGKKYKVRVTFEDDLGHREVLESIVFPINAGEVVISRPFLVTLDYWDFIERQNGTVHYRFDLNSNFKFYMSKRDMRKHAFNITNGVIKRAYRLQSNWQFIPGHSRPKPVTRNWRIEIKPIDPTQDIVIELESNRTCDEKGAICSIDGERYTEGTSRIHTPNVDPLTVTIKDTTATEGGLMLFDVEISRETKNIVKVWTRTTQEGTATKDVDFAAVEHLTLFTHSRSQELTKQVGVKIYGDAHVDDAETVAVEIIRAELIKNGKTRYQLSITNNKAIGTITNVVPVEITLPKLSISDATAKEKDKTIDFVVTLSKAPNKIVRVDYFLWSGTAVAGQDFQVPDIRTLCFLPAEYTNGETCKVDTTQIISIPIIDDIIDEGSETFTLQLRNPSNATIDDGEATGTITNSDPLQKMWLSRFGKIIGGQIVDTISDRVNNPSNDSQIILVGQRIINSTPVNLLMDDTKLWKQKYSRSMDGLEVLTTSSFSLTTKDKNKKFSIWGKVVMNNFGTQKDEISLNGKIITGIFGTDIIYKNWLTGVAISRTLGSGNFSGEFKLSDSDNLSGKIKSTLTSLNPYIRYKINENLYVWSLIGYGFGNMKINGGINSDLQMYLGAAGINGKLFGNENTNLSIDSNALFVQMNSDITKTESSRFKTSLKGKHSFNIGKGKIYTGLDFGLIYDGGDAETGMGIEIGGKIGYTYQNWLFEVEIHKLLAHNDSKYNEWGIGGTIKLEPKKSGAGPYVSLSSTFNNSLNKPIREEVLKLSTDESNHQFNVELGYGFSSILPETLILYVGNSNEIYRLGLRYNNWSLETGHKKDNFIVMFSGNIYW